MDKVLVVSSTQKSIDLLTVLLKSNGYQNIQSVSNGTEARRVTNQSDFSIIIVNSPLSDEFGVDLCISLTEITCASIILIAKNEIVDDLSAKVENFGVLVMGKPINRAVFYQTVKLAVASRRRIVGLQQQNVKLQNKIEEIRCIDKAKCFLIEQKGMTESQAHRYIEKMAMDNRKTRKEVAENILRQYYC